MSFFASVLVAWAAIFCGLELARRRWPAVWPASAPARSRHPWTDLSLGMVAAGGVLGIGQLWHAKWLDWHLPGAWDNLAFAASQVVVWSPIPLLIVLRRQRADTAWTGAADLPLRAAVGVGLGVLGITVNLAMRNDVSRLPQVILAALSGRAMAHFVPVYFEGVGVAFLFVRLQWSLGRRLAALLPAVLFAAAHLPRGIELGEPPAVLLSFFLFNTGFVTVLLLVLARYRDVVALGLAHWLTDLAIGAF